MAFHPIYHASNFDCFESHPFPARLIEARAAPVFHERGEFCEVIMMDRVPRLC